MLESSRGEILSDEDMLGMLQHSAITALSYSSVIASSPRAPIFIRLEHRRRRNRSCRRSAHLNRQILHIALPDDRRGPPWNGFAGQGSGGAATEARQTSLGATSTTTSLGSRPSIIACSSSTASVPISSSGMAIAVSGGAV